MNSCDFRVFLQEFGTTVHLSLPGSVSEKERLILPSNSGHAAK